MRHKIVAHTYTCITYISLLVKEVTSGFFYLTYTFSTIRLTFTTDFHWLILRIIKCWRYICWANVSTRCCSVCFSLQALFGLERQIIQKHIGMHFLIKLPCAMFANVSTHWQFQPIASNMYFKIKVFVVLFMRLSSHHILGYK